MEIAPQEFRDVQTLVRQLCGLVLSDDKTYLVRMRLEPVALSHGCTRFSDYLGRLQQLGAAVMRDEMVEALTTGETSFNRDGHPFDEFRRRILPALAEGLRRRREAGFPFALARLWSAGCSTGQEPYSLAMAVHDFVAANRALELGANQFPIFASDVSNRCLDVARAGRYADRELDRGLPAESRSRHFRRIDDDWIVNDELRRLVEFRRLNLIDHLTGIGSFEVIFCRNVLIYFDTPTRQRLSEQFHQFLSPGGLLILGAAESLYGLETSFISERLGSTTVYRKARETTALQTGLPS
jgi:chemotaxis protein methyltransferase CheR